MLLIRFFGKKMIAVDKIIQIIEDFAPPSLAEEWDNSGWQIKLGIKEVNNVMLCLSVTPQIIEQAVYNNCGLIISHHPLIFSGIKKIDTENVVNNLIVDCIKHNIQVYSAHTNLDCTSGGVNDILCEKLGLIYQENLNKFVKITQLPEKMSVDSFILKLKISLNAPKIKLINPQNIQEIKTVAICSGSGSEFINDVIGKADAYITGDVKYHSALEVRDIVVIDAGHFETEKIILQTLKNLLHTEIPDIITGKENEPWVIV